jgi:Coenzyme PQQ synthesis protein D (PqqD)
MTYQLSSSVSLVRDVDGAVLLHRDRGLVYALNPTAEVILQGLQAGHDLARIEHDLRQSFLDVEGEPRDDIVALIDQLLATGLLVREAGGARS